MRLLPCSAALATLLFAAPALALSPPAPLPLQPCTVPGHDDVLLCGSLPVPEDRSRGDGRTIALKIVVIPALEPDPAWAPLYDLAGGPGLPATGSADFYLGDGAINRRHRDVVLVDQRGTGGSAPLLCPELDGTGSTFPDAAVRSCRERLGRIADLAHYTTADAVADLQAVRAALGHGAVDLVALSYGTRLALAWIAAEPAAVRSAALMGTLPVDGRPPLWHARNGQDTLDAVFADCRADAACAAAFPRLAQDWATLQARPDFVGAAREALRNKLAMTPGQLALPALITQLAKDGPATLLAPSTSPPLPYADGLFLSVTCAEDIPWFADDVAAATRDTFLGDWRIERQRAACAIWDVPARKLDYASAPSPVPVLFIAGERDYVTPVAWAEQVATAFANGRVVRIPGLGHAPEGVEGLECLDEMIATLGRTGDTAAVDAGCVAKIVVPAFSLRE